jgi:4'-phosphopantetheinyl transferase
LTAIDDWSPPPPRPALGRGDAAVWLLDRRATPRPIEMVLSRYLGLRPDGVVLHRAAGGKPELPGSPLRAGLAHTAGIALVAVASGREVGVDVERLRAGRDSWSLTAHALTDAERRALRAAPPSRRADAFTSIWTRKEAILKAAGVGLSVDPRFVGLDGQAVSSVPPDFGPASDWTVVDLPLPGYAAALALRGPLASLFLLDARQAEEAA